MKENHILPFLWMRGEGEEIIRTEIEKISEAGIKSVCLEARPHPEYAGAKWWHDVDVVIEEAQKRDMQIWILDDAHFPTGMANDGMKKYPDKCRRFLYTQFVDVVGPMPYAQVDVDLLMTKQITWMDLGKPQETPLLEECKLLSVTAYKVAQDDCLTGEYINLTQNVTDGYLTADIPEGVWRIFVTFSTTLIGNKLDYINYVEKDSVRVLIDEVYEKHYEKYKDLFGTVIAGFFSDEPGFYNAPGYDDNNKLGKKMPLPWGKEVDQLLTKRFGEEIYAKLPLLYAEDEKEEYRICRVAYMDIVSELYSKNFSCQLGDWCREHGVSYIGHVVEDANAHMRLVAGVGHYFRAMKGQDMAGIDTIGYQIMPCNDVASRHTGFQDLTPSFYHYELGKLGASSAAIDPAKKGRLMCESFGAYGWRFGVRDMKWLVDFLVCQGVNYFVPHAFSMAEYPDVDCPPHFYARGNNPEYKYFCKLMKYTDRLCNLFSDGMNVPQVAVLYGAEADWAGKHMMGCEVGKVLLSNQIDFEFIPADVFKDQEYYNCKVEGTSLIINQRKMDVLIVPQSDYISEEAARFIASNPQLEVIYIDSYPVKIAEGNHIAIPEKTLDNKKCVHLDKLVTELKNQGVQDDLWWERSHPSLRQYHYKKNGENIYFLMNVSASEIVEGKFHLPKEKTYGRYDAMSDEMVAFDIEDGVAKVSIKPYESIIICSNPSGDCKHQKVMEYTKELKLFDFDLELHEIGNEDITRINHFKLKPISNIRRDFSGELVYRTKIELDEIPKNAVIQVEYLYECMTVVVNHSEVEDKITPPYEVDITRALVKGENEIEIRVCTTPLRNANTKPGIFGKERTILEPTGMFGKVSIKMI